MENKMNEKEEFPFRDIVGIPPMHPVYGYELARTVDGKYGDIGYCESCNSSIGHFHKSGCTGIFTIVTEKVNKMKRKLQYILTFTETKNRVIENIEEYTDEFIGEISNNMYCFDYDVEFSVSKTITEEEND